MMNNTQPQPPTILWKSKILKANLMQAEGASVQDTMMVELYPSGAIESSIALHTVFQKLQQLKANGALPGTIEMARVGKAIHLVIKGVAVAGDDEKVCQNAEMRLKDAIEGTAKMLGYGDRGNIQCVMAYVARLPEINALVRLEHGQPARARGE
jgi:hypothetical protein